MKKGKATTFHVQAVLKNVTVGFEIGATSLEDALTKTKTMRAGEAVLQDDVEWIDGDMTITGVYE